MDANNVVVVRGVVSSEPRLRELPAGSVVTQLDVTTRGPGLTASVPVAAYDRPVDAGSGDQVVVTGHVNRRFFRAGGVTQSRTELVAAEVIRVGRKRAADRAISAVVELLTG
jgi:single-strand DNA-binding protein